MRLGEMNIDVQKQKKERCCEDEAGSNKSSLSRGHDLNCHFCLQFSCSRRQIARWESKKLPFF